MTNNAEIFAEVDRLLKLGQSLVLATVMRTQGSTPRKAGAKMIVREDGSCTGTICGGCVEAEVYAKAKELFVPGAKPQTLKYTLNDDAAAEFGLRCGGMMEVYLEKVSPKFRLYVIGAGHIGSALAAITRNIGFEVHVVDDHPGFLAAEHFPGCILHQESFDRIGDVVPEGSHVAAVIATRGHSQDAAAFRGLLNHELGYFGLVASWKRVMEFYKPLLADGVPLERLRRISSPVGLDIGSETPEEIAVAVAAELLAVMKGGRQISLSKLFWESGAAEKLPALATK